MTRTPEQRATIQEAQAIKRAERKEAKKKRPPNPKKDRGRKREPLYLAWLRRQPCALDTPFWCSRNIDAAHIRSHRPGERPTGLQRKPDDARATPLCRRHHIEQHGENEMRFWTRYVEWPFASMDSTDVAQNHNREWNDAVMMAQRWNAANPPAHWTVREPAPAFWEEVA